MATKKKPVPVADVLDAINLGTEALCNEMRKLRKLSEDREMPLSREDSGQLIKYLHAAIAISKDNREGSLQQELSEMPDDELERLAREALERKSA